MWSAVCVRVCVWKKLRDVRVLLQTCITHILKVPFKKKRVPYAFTLKGYILYICVVNKYFLFK